MNNNYINTIIVRDINTLFLIMDRTTRKTLIKRQKV